MILLEFAIDDKAFAKAMKEKAIGYFQSLFGEVLG